MGCGALTEKTVGVMLAWTYLDNGRIKSVESNNEVFASLILDADAFDIDKGKYA